MSELLAFYQQQAQARFSHTPWVSALQQQALDHFIQMGFPTRHTEDWKYTPVTSFLKQPFVISTPISSFEARRGEPVPVAHHPVMIHNGTIKGLEDCQALLPSGVILMSLTQAVADHPALIQPYLNQILPEQHAFHSLNTAMMHSGVFIYVPAGVTVSLPVLLSHWQDGSHQAAYLRHVIILEPRSQLQLIEDYQGDAETSYVTNSVTEIHLAPEAHLTHYKIQRESTLAYHTGHLAVKQEASSQFDSHSFSIGSQWMRSDITIDLNEPDARCLMNGIYAPHDGQHMDHHTLVTHAAPSCRSEQDYKGILSGHSRAVFNGRVLVQPGAQHTEAKQSNKNLLLSPDTEIDTKPQLEIYADDVVCTHGATVGQLDEDALFYLATRGIGREEASRYLIQAFAEANLRLLDQVSLSDWIASLLRVV